MLDPSLRMKKNESIRPLGLKRLVPNYYFSYSCLPHEALVRFPCNASLSQPNVQKNSRALVRGVGA